MVADIATPASLEELQELVLDAGRRRLSICAAGGRHAMGGQQFRRGALLVDTRRMSPVRMLDRDRGLVDVEAGAQWPDLIARLHQIQSRQPSVWSIIQKQTGADRMTIGGALSANIHGRGLRYAPLVQDVESFTIVDPAGIVRECSRELNPALFRLVIGGYGLFGIIASVRLRLTPRRKVMRCVEVVERDQLMRAFGRRIAEGCAYGDFQFAIDPASDDFLSRGVFACYRPVDDETVIPPDQRELSEADWHELYRMAHCDKSRAFDAYTSHYRRTHGQIYWSDEHQLATYTDGYHLALDREAGRFHRATEMISELYVPRPALSTFLASVAADLRRHETDAIYGTVRLIEQDHETFLPWARQPWACIVFNLCTTHTPEGLSRSADAFRRLIDRARDSGGSFYLTYHRWATAEQMEECHPQLRAFLTLKQAFDPDERFSSDWYVHCRRLMFEDQLPTSNSQFPDVRMVGSW
jgi:FAD/FMN-containing dehydrogenase